MALLKKSDLQEKLRKSSGFLAESSIRNFAESELRTAKLAADRSAATYDIFLSHSSEDAIYIKALRDQLVEVGFTVYVDWIDDPQLDRSNVTKHTAAVLRTRMNSCQSLLYATSQAAKNPFGCLGNLVSWTPRRMRELPSSQSLTTIKQIPSLEDKSISGFIPTSTKLAIHSGFMHRPETMSALRNGLLVPTLSRTH